MAGSAAAQDMPPTSPSQINTDQDFVDCVLDQTIRDASPRADAPDGSFKNSFRFASKDLSGERKDVLRVINSAQLHAKAYGMAPARPFVVDIHERWWKDSGITEPDVPPEDPSLQVKIGFSERRLKGEDTHAVLNATMGGRRYTMVGLFDGHGGGAASDFCAEELLRFVQEAAAASEDGGTSMASWADACEAAFLRCHTHLRELPGCVAGTTATVLVIDAQRRQALCANVGDSAVLVIDPDQYGFASTDHRLHSSMEEQDRVLRAGGRLAYAKHPATHMPAGVLRLWPGGLAVGRSIGDADCGNVVISTPAVEVVRLPEAGATLAMCTDGVWDAIGAADVAELVRARPDVDALATRVCEACLRVRGLRDDTTAFVIQIGDGAARDALDYDPHGSAHSASGGLTPGPDGRRRGLLARAMLALFSSCTSVPEEPQMTVSIKGGEAFTELYRADARTPPVLSRRAVGAGGAADDGDGVDSSVDWAHDRIGENSTLKQPQKGQGGDESSTVTESSTGGSSRTASSTPRVPAAHKPIPPGRKIHWNEIGEGGFSDMKFIGAGEFCSVFSTSLDGGRQIAIKMLRPDKLTSAQAVRDLEFEMHLIARIQHKHVVRCIGTSLPDVPNERKFIALQTLRTTLHDALPPPPLADGSSTLARLTALKRWPLARALQLSLELAIALRHLHDHCFAT